MDLLKLAATPLHGRLSSSWDAEPRVLRLTADPAEPQRAQHGLLLSAPSDDKPSGFAQYLCRDSNAFLFGDDKEVVALPPELVYLTSGDILRLNPRRREIWVMYRRGSLTNSLLLTERCNSWCVMCSQPPKPDEDETLVRSWLEAIPLIDPGTKEIGFTGGEPTLLGDVFLELVRLCRDHLPNTSLHVLSNGRLFNYLSLAQALAAVAPSDTMIGIPLYSDLAWQHDYIVQAPKAFDQTIRGILNLARCNVPVEIRVVIHRHSYERLPDLAEFICRNLPFVQQIALMGLEPIGFARGNLSALWIDPLDYQEELATAARTFLDHGMNVSIYNHQLCVLPKDLWPVARQSISDWKNVYLAECGSCGVRDSCGGFFHSATKAHSRGISPLEASDSPAVTTF